MLLVLGKLDVRSGLHVARGLDVAHASCRGCFCFLTPEWRKFLKVKKLSEKVFSYLSEKVTFSLLTRTIFAFDIAIKGYSSFYMARKYSFNAHTVKPMYNDHRPPSGPKNSDSWSLFRDQLYTKRSINGDHYRQVVAMRGWTLALD